MTEMSYGRMPQSNKQISKIVQGTAYFQEHSKAEHLDYLDKIYELGCTAVDTAHTYGRGTSERILGEWISSRGIRDNIFILGKGGHPSMDRDDRITTFDITSDLHDSLARLRTDHIDLYLMHRDSPILPVGVLVELFNDFIREGKILAYGGSNWTTERIAEANAYAAAHGLIGFAASSPQFSLAAPIKPPWPGCLTISGEDYAADRAWYADNNMPLFVWSSLAAGFFTGRFTPDNLDQFFQPDAFWLDRACAEAYCTPENFALLERTQQLGEQKGLAAIQIAVAYIVNHPLQPFAVMGCRAIDEFTTNLEAASTQLTAAEMAWLETGEA